MPCLSFPTRTEISRSTSSGADGKPAGIAGLALNITKTGSISGEKFNDANGNQVKGAGESGLAGWVIYLDQNNDGQLNSTSDQNINIPAPNIPQPIIDATSTGGATTKNQLQYEDAGTVLNLTVTLDITHTFDADLRVWLISPTGTKVQAVREYWQLSRQFHAHHV